MPTTLDKLIASSAARLGKNVDRHRATPAISLAQHVRWMRQVRAARVTGKRIVYLDTNAWKCLADFEQQKPKLTSAMQDFALATRAALLRGDTVFPIGLATFFELDSMTSEDTHNALVTLVDDLSKGYCVAPFPECIGMELDQLRAGDFNLQEDRSSYLRSPVELLGIPAASFAPEMAALIDENTFNKAFFDTISELPFSLQLQVARSAPGPKWSNSRSTAELNTGKQLHQDEVPNLNTGILLELKGCIEAWCIGEQTSLDPKQVLQLAAAAMYHWHQVPRTKALPTMRILSSLYGLMRFDPQRRYQDGDPSDFTVAAAALPVADALLTDRRLAILLSDPRIALNQFLDCTVVSGFEGMAEYISRPHTPSDA
ncbi:MAG: hypothetical protein Q7J58_00010 [Hydrogenophaga sp.]|uniref:hypothetical protein n=1 Tax=Hydrogenophaga sp. TaxID=1904254 RepID=UPI0027251D2C|nr:hypothetical protein [Hydrogenophaga sp.]MDO9567757.1 hypothetical protein [Hydrogenophaga sp.]MDP3376539.1 hypothetical protein [Hydrogenophaga sp.]